MNLTKRQTEDALSNFLVEETGLNNIIHMMLYVINKVSDKFPAKGRL